MKLIWQCCHLPREGGLPPPALRANGTIGSESDEIRCIRDEMRRSCCRRKEDKEGGQV